MLPSLSVARTSGFVLEDEESETDQREILAEEFNKSELREIIVAGGGRVLQVKL